MKTLLIELDGLFVRSLEHDSVLEDIFDGQIERFRATNIEWNNSDSWWEVIDAKAGKVVKNGFKKRSEALEWEQEEYKPGSRMWNRSI